MERLLKAAAVCLVVLTLIAVALPGRLGAEPPPPGLADLKARLWRGELPPYVRPLEPQEGPLPMASAEMENLAQWSRIAWQSHRDGNWEIYWAPGDGSEPRRLTDNPAADTRPRLNRGATRVVFTSDRSGNWEIYTANVDGSGLQRLTSTAASEAGPVWSPDGTRILFASNRDGNWELYVMSADGAAVSRLTNHAAEDVMPSWSPAGDRIAWVRPSGDDAAIWVMDANGANPHALTQPLRYLQHPAWSPDGTRLAFDYDSDADLWNELATLQADGSGGITVVYNPSTSIWDMDDHWVGCWTPDGQWLVYSVIHYAVQGNQLYVRSAHIDRIGASGGGLPDRVLGSGLDISPDWQSTDCEAPRVRIYPVPRYLRGELETTAFPVAWAGWDPGTSGLRAFDVDVWDGQTRQWRTWQADTLQVTSLFTARAGYTYAFRVRGRDHAGNVSPWAGGLDNCVTVYKVLMRMRVTDSRDVPLGGVVARSVPPLATVEDTVYSEPDGWLLACLSGVPSTMTLSKPGYLSAAPVDQGYLSERTRSVVLGPDDNVVRNSGFEEESPSPWEVNGPAATVLGHEEAYTGLGRAHLYGEPPVPVSVNVSTNAGASGPTGAPRLARDNSGALHAVWADSTPGWSAIYYSTRPPGGNWTPPVSIATGHRGECQRPDLAVTGDGTVHVAWLDVAGQANVTYAARPRGAGWAAPRDISGLFTLPPAPREPGPALAASGQGEMHAVWADATGLRYVTRGEGGAWPSPVAVFAGGDSPALAVGPDGRAHLTWRDVDAGHELLYSSRPSGGSWETPDAVTTRPGPKHRPSLAVGPQGSVYVAWVGGDALAGPDCGVYVDQRSPQGDWTEIADRLGAYHATGIRVAVDASQRVHLAVARSGPESSNIKYDVRFPDGIWSVGRPLRELSGNQVAAGPALCVEENGLAHVAWYEGTPAGNTEISCADVNYTTPSVVSLSQRVTIPTTMHKPTLSFAYVLGAADSAPAFLEARIGATTLFSTTVTDWDWKHAWRDLSPWAGRTVTLTVAVRSQAIGYWVGSYLDDITIGSWKTPLVRSISPARVRSQEPTSVTISGENMIATPTVRVGQTALTNVRWIDEHMLQATVPAGLAPGVYTLWVTNPGGQEMGLSHALTVGEQRYLPALLMNWPP